MPMPTASVWVHTTNAYFHEGERRSHQDEVDERSGRIWVIREGSHEGGKGKLSALLTSRILVLTYCIGSHTAYDQATVTSCRYTWTFSTTNESPCAIHINSGWNCLHSGWSIRVDGKEYTRGWRVSTSTAELLVILDAKFHPCHQAFARSSLAPISPVRLQ